MYPRFFNPPSTPTLVTLLSTNAHGPSLSQKHAGLQHDHSSGQSYNHFTIVNYNSRVVNYGCKVLYKIGHRMLLGLRGGLKEAFKLNITLVNW